MSTKKLLCLSGSQRMASWNTRLLQHLAGRWSPHCELTWLNPQDLQWPLFNEDLEHDPALQAQVLQASALVQAADGVVLASPEYNGMVSPYLKNTIDWVSRMPRVRPDAPAVFLDKPVLLCAASTGGSGGAVGLANARALLAYLGACVFGETITVAHAHTRWTDLGYWFEPEFETASDDVLQRFVRFLR